MLRMVQCIFAALCLYLNIQALYALKTNNLIEFVVVIPSYNNETVCLRNLESVVNQTYPHWSIVYIDDCSTDSTGALVDEFVKKRMLSGRCKVIHNKTRKGAMHNYYKAIMKIDSKKVVATLDGDDFLAHHDVLKVLSDVYADDSVWATHGNYTTFPFTASSYCYAYPQEIQNNAAFRSYVWLGCQLRTFYAKLFHKIKKEDLAWQGSFVPMTSDLAFMFPILELASQGHIRFIEEELYIVNTANPLSDAKVDKPLQLEIEKHIRSLPPYKPLKKLF
jgi:glycosyltransferase involved in cell wall biosynthesis